jgi:rod shape determining protein RodA
MRDWLKRLDRALLLPMLALMALGLLTLFSAGRSGQGMVWIKQALWFCLSLGIMTFMAGRSPQRLFRLSLALYILGLVLLVLVLIPGIGLKLGAKAGAQRWLGSKALALTFQPSELMKWITLLFVADHLGRRAPDQVDGMAILGAISAVVLPMLLVFKQPDLGMAISFLPILVLIPLIRGLRARWVLLALGAILLLGTVAWNTRLMSPYQKDRVVSFLNPDLDPKGKNYQVNQSRIAIGAGGLVGRGFTGGSQSQLNFLPVKTTDFIFAVWAEERGFLGVLLALGLFGLFLSRILAVAREARTPPEAYFCVGAAAIIALHLLVNVGMVAGFLPNKGMVLPFFSYGGSSTLSYFLGMGVIMAVAYRAKVG